MIDLSVIIPTYNEKDNIPILVNRLRDVLNGLCRYEIIVVDDDSPDRTWEVVAKLSEADDHLVGFRRRGEQGLSSAVVYGMLHARGDLLAVMDGDLQHDESILPEMMRAIDGMDVVVGSRKVSGGGSGEWGKLRKVVSWSATRLAHLALPLSVNDPMSGYFVLRREVFERIRDKIDTRGFKILLEILGHVDRNRVREVGYVFRNRGYGESKLDTDVMLEYLTQVYNLRFGKVVALEFIKYCIVGLSGVFVNLGTVSVLELAGFSDQVSLVWAIGLAMVSNFFINNSWTFRKNKVRGLGIIVGLAKFVATSSMGAVINFAAALYVKTQLGLYLVIADAVGIALATLWNYTMSRRWIWSDGRA